jgi:plasmid stabilization system protein ParE
MRFVIEFAESARRDVDHIMARSEAIWGAVAVRRYQALFTSAAKDLSMNPDRTGATMLTDLEGIGLYRVELSRQRAGMAAARIKTPSRHVFLFKRDQAKRRILVLRVLHEAMDLPRHIEASLLQSPDPSSQTDSS